MKNLDEKLQERIKEQEEGGYFVLAKKTALDDLNEENILPESDLTIQTSSHVLQYLFVEPDEDKEDKYIIKPGVYTITNSNRGIALSKLTLRTHDLLETASTTSLIMNEANTFFSKIDLYKQFKKDPKRAILLYSSPGMGKSATISKLSQQFIEQDPGTVVIFWDTSDIRASNVSRFLSTKSVFSENSTRLLFIMEDIGGGNIEDYHGPKSADSGLLELLDGASVSFSIPTFIIATTNTPQSLLKSLADRPGRFDQMFELEPPTPAERVKLATHIAGRELENEEKLALEGKDSDGLSIAHISEIIIRSALHDKNFAQVIEEMKDHRKKIDQAFAKIKNKMGFGGNG